jgi:transposase-like protein
MRVCCLKCEFKGEDGSKFERKGHFYRRSTSEWIQKYRCHSCRGCFSDATFQACYRQKKRQKNFKLERLLVSHVSQRRAAELLSLSRTTIARKLVFLAIQALYRFRRDNHQAKPATIIEFDDLETFEETKCKPLSVTIAVEYKTRRILGFEVSVMPCRGLLAAKSREIYGPRPDGRPLARESLFESIKPFMLEGAEVKSDSNPHYPPDVARHFPLSKHSRFLGRKPASTGQGEMKKGGFDPLFSLNHTCAMLRANVNRLTRKTWCTTKKSERLWAHLVLYFTYHNEKLALARQ